MSYPFFSLSKSKRVAPIDFRTGDVIVRVDGTLAHGIATIWDADVLIWAASHLTEARDAGVATARRIMASPCEILRFIGRGTSARDYARLRAALDRLQSTTVSTSLPQRSSRQVCRFPWIEEWKDGLEITLSEAFYDRVVSQCAVLTIDRAYFRLKGGIERWLYRLVRKHAERQPGGWRFNFRCLHAKSGSLASFADFAVDVRRIAARKCLLGYRLVVEKHANGDEVLAFTPERGQQRTIGAIVKQLTSTMSRVDKL